MWAFYTSNIMEETIARNFKKNGFKKNKNVIFKAES